MGSIVDRKRTEGGKVRRYIVFKDLDRRQKWVACPSGTTMAQAKIQLAAAETNVANGKVGIVPKPSAEAVKARRITLSALIDRFCAEYTNPQVKELSSLVSNRVILDQPILRSQEVDESGRQG